MNSHGDSSDSVNLIDIVFTAVLTVSLTPEVIGMEGMLSEGWVRAAMAGKSVEMTPAESVHFMTFVIGASTLLLSWVGIHASLHTKPIKYETTAGMFRFMLDVTLIFSYGLVLLFFRQFDVALFLLALIYLTFVVWDVLKIVEYREVYFSPTTMQQLGLSTAGPFASAKVLVKYFSRQFVSLWFAICFVVLWVVSSGERRSHPLLIASLALMFTALYRVGKNHPRFCVLSTLAIDLSLLAYVFANGSIPSAGH
jgi:hypothetical protein